MQKILLLNGGKAFGHSNGLLSKTLHETARQTLLALGKSIDETIIDDGYDAQKEVEKFLIADTVIYQMPGWWMSEPWIVKKYIDEVFTAGIGRLVANDGRSHVNPAINYGRGGLSHGKKYMFSLTWNAPIEAFTQPGEFFDGRGVDEVYLHLHKAHEFCGFSALPTFICNDVIKNPQVAKYIKDYKAHLIRVFG